MTGKIAFQGELGAYSHEACRKAYPDMEPLPCPVFADAMSAVLNGDADLAMIAVENSTYGRVADVHRLLPSSGLYTIAEAFVRVRISLLGIAGAKLDDIKRVRSMSVLLGQCGKFLQDHNLKTLNWSDNAAAAREIASMANPAEAALASSLAGEIYGLDVLAENIEDSSNNTTRFLVMSREPDYARRGTGPMTTSFVFRVRSIPAALYKAMGGFATNGVNMTKLESYMLDGSFTATQFYADIDGHPEDDNVKLAMEELDYFADHIKILGVYPQDVDHRQ